MKECLAFQCTELNREWIADRAYHFWHFSSVIMDMSDSMSEERTTRRYCWRFLPCSWAAVRLLISFCIRGSVKQRFTQLFSAEMAFCVIGWGMVNTGTSARVFAAAGRVEALEDHDVAEHYRRGWLRSLRHAGVWKALLKNRRIGLSSYRRSQACDGRVRELERRPNKQSSFVRVGCRQCGQLVFLEQISLVSCSSRGQRL